MLGVGAGDDDPHAERASIDGAEQPAIAASSTLSVIEMRRRDVPVGNGRRPDAAHVEAGLPEAAATFASFARHRRGSAAGSAMPLARRPSGVEPARQRATSALKRARRSGSRSMMRKRRPPRRHQRRGRGREDETPAAIDEEIA